MATFFSVLFGTALAIAIGAGVLHLIPRLGTAGKRLSDALCRAPLLDVSVTYFTVAPLFAGPIIDGWRGLAAAVVGQFVGMWVWQTAHTLAHPAAARGPRIVKILNQKVGTARNLVAVYATAVVTPVFWLIRVAELVVWPVLTATVRLPKYDHGEWVNCSRQKFDGLVGHDLIWCLYCDWMTGVWSLASEMLRNVESFWCPIRFRSDKKCANCAIDFPDVNAGWVPADATMADATAKLDAMYENEPTAASRPWFNHPVRLTVNGRATATESAARV